MKKIRVGRTIDAKMKQKGSEYRNKVAMILNCWRKNHSVTKTVETLKISQPTIQKALKQSTSYINSKYRVEHLNESDIAIQMNEKNSNIRKNIASLLSLWRKTKSINSMSQTLNISKPKIRKLLRLSKSYKDSRSIKKNTMALQMNQKDSECRNYLAKILNLWRKNHSLEQTAKKLNVRFSFLLRRIVLSKAYKESKYRRQNNQSNYSENLMKLKNSEYRNQLAKILLEWKKLRSMDQVSKSLKISIATVTKMFNKSTFFKNRKKYSENEMTHIRGWSKKIWAVNSLGGVCQKCKTNDFFVLEFHHSSKNKEGSLSYLIWKRPKGSFQKIKKEIKKCTLLCRNCHQELHHPNAKNLFRKKELMKIVGEKKCVKCGYNKNLTCIEFHHLDPKNKGFNIGNLGNMGRTLKKARYIEEIKKCQPLCCNCHLKESIKMDKFEKLKLAIAIKVRLINANYPTVL